MKIFSIEVCETYNLITFENNQQAIVGHHRLDSFLGEWLK